ncbi:Rossmann-like domain-containing protein [Oscillospiraceae bacterium LTW-04]|nr:DUF364 domain-containing protein [Oscillospiraceae bacterium MB24-C1]
MLNNFWELYDTLLHGLPENVTVSQTVSGAFWTLAEADNGGTGLAMTTSGDTFPPMYPGGIKGMPLKDAAKAAKSWNLLEAGFGVAAMNAAYNTLDRMNTLDCEEPYDNYSTEGLNITGKTVGVIGHLKMPSHILRDAKQVYILERHPKEGDYPDSACDLLLPKCDIVIITGSSLVNKTLPHLLELCKNAYTILTGPTVPMCPELLNCGIDRLAGLVVTNRPGIRQHAESSTPGPPFSFGRTFLLKGE